LAYRWFCKLDLEDKVPHHSTFSENRLGRFRESDLLRHIFERVVWAAMAMGLVKGEGFAVVASVLEANASRYHGVPPGEITWTDAQKQKRAVAEYLDALGSEANRQAHAESDTPTFSTPSAQGGRLWQRSNYVSYPGVHLPCARRLRTETCGMRVGHARGDAAPDLDCADDY
jgi:hypothetical protein